MASRSIRGRCKRWRTLWIWLCAVPLTLGTFTTTTDVHLPLSQHRYLAVRHGHMVLGAARMAGPMTLKFVRPSWRALLTPVSFAEFDRTSAQGWSRDIEVSWWFVSIVMNLGIMTVAFARRPRARLGRCRACGYDLRGTLSRRCPECGNILS